MSDYFNALQEGFEAARRADVARTEINNVLEIFRDEILKGSDGKLLVERRQFEEEDDPYTRLLSISATASIWDKFTPKKTYQALTASNPLAANQTYKQLARWEQSKDGYPCSLIYNKQERQFEDRAALEKGLVELLKEPSIGESLYSLMNQK